MRIAREGRAPQRLYQFPDLPDFTKLRYLPRDAYYCGGESVPLLDDQDNVNTALVDRVAADQITPYPPGIPVLVPGQEITRKVIDYLVGLLRSQKRVEMHGIVYDGYLPCLRVLKASEERSLRKLG
jgi:arginine decarboxylase